MELFEYQSKELLERFHVPCPPHVLIKAETASERISGLGGGLLIPQVRGSILGEREKNVSNGEEALIESQNIFKEKVITDESGPEGFFVEKVLFLPHLSKDKELSLSVRVIAPGEIEVQLRNGERIFSEFVPERRRLFLYQLSRLVFPLSLSLQLKESLAKAIEGVIAAFFSYDASSIEIDPFIITEENNLLAYRVRMHVDEMAFFRQKEIQELCQEEQRTERELLTHSSLPYRMGEGSIGCLSNGKGLGEYTAMAVQKMGGAVAGVVDIGDLCHEENLITGLRVLVRDPHVNVVCMNLLTGLVDGQKVVSTILKALSTISGGVIRGRFFLRLEGTNAGRGIALAEASDVLKVTSFLDEAAALAAAASQDILPGEAVRGSKGAGAGTYTHLS